jgi:hypothetical protein
MNTSRSRIFMFQSGSSSSRSRKLPNVYVVPGDEGRYHAISAAMQEEAQAHEE